MSDAFSRQTTDNVNSAGFGTTKLNERQPEFLKPNRLEDGNASGKGKTEPADKTGAR